MQFKRGSGSITSSSEYLQDLIAEAIAKSHDLGDSVLLSYSEAWQSIDPLSFLANKSHPQQYKFYWEHPQSNITLAAAGIAVMMPTNTDNTDLRSNRFDLAQQFTQKCFGNAVVGGNNGGVSPHVLGGFSFHDRSDCSVNSTWRNFPRVMFFVPRWLMRQVKLANGEICTDISINYWIQPDQELLEVQKILEQVLADLKIVDNLEIETRKRKIAITEIREIIGDRPWTEIVQQVVPLIQCGELEKVVLSRALDVIADSKFDAFQVLDNLRTSYPECVSFLCDFGANSSFLGATPEVLLQFHSQQQNIYLRSNAVAGSTRRGQSLGEDLILANSLLSSSKDLSEHKIVVKFICDRLRDLGAIVAPLDVPKLLKLVNVQHLYTPISAHLLDCSWTMAFDVLEQLHPTAAVGGEPKEDAIALMQKWEAMDRGWYAAPIGWVNANGEGTFAVGIRSGYLEDNKARIYAGAGIVADSQFDSELDETALKFEALLKALGM